MRDYDKFCQIVIVFLQSRFEGSEVLVGAGMDFESIREDLLGIHPIADNLAFNMAVVLIESGLFENRVCSTNPIVVWNPLKLSYKCFVEKYPDNYGFADDVSKPDLNEVVIWLEGLIDAPVV